MPHKSITITQLLRPQKRFVFGAFMMVVLAVFAVLYLGKGLRTLIDQGFDEHLTTSIFHLFLGVTLLAIASAGRYYNVTIMGEYMGTALKKKLFNHMLFMRASLYLSEPLEHWQKILNEDVDRVTHTFTQNVPALLRNILLCLGGLSGLLLIHTQLALILFGFLPLVLCILFVFLKTLKAQKNAFENAENQKITFLNERLKHLFFIRAASLGAKTNFFLNLLLKAKTHAHTAYIFKRAIFVGLAFFLAFGAVVSFLWIGATFVLNGKLTSGDLTSFLFYAVIMAISASSLSEHYGDITKAKTLFKNIQDIFLLETEQSHEHGEEMPEDASLTFKNVTFKYAAHLPEVLHNLSFTLKKGEKVGLIGGSGAGKSTLFKLILGFYEPQTGEILWGKTPMQNLSLQDLRENIAYIPQDPVIFEDTLYHNVTLWESYDQELVLDALKKARASDILEKLPQGLNTVLGPKGVTLSRGENQRLALARIFLKDPQILLLDEPTSSLDPENEKYVTEALHNLMEGRTALMITHRHDTTKDLDNIWVMDKGHIA